jgi:hypothetical protein
VGVYKFAVKLTGLGGEAVTDTVYLHVAAPTGIVATTPQVSYKTTIYDVSGRLLPITDEALLPKGIYVIKRESASGVELRKIVK